MTMLLAASLLVFFLLVQTLLIVFGHKEDKGYSAGQRVIRTWFRLSRWTWAQAKGWDAFLLHFRRAVSARRTELQSAMREPLPDLSSPAASREIAGFTARGY